MSLAATSSNAESEAEESSIPPVLNDLPGNRRSAVAEGSKIYFTGLPCKRGHYAPRYTITGSCTQCAIESAAQTRKELRIVMSKAIEKKAAAANARSGAVSVAEKAANNG